MNNTRPSEIENIQEEMKDSDSGANKMQEKTIVKDEYEEFKQSLQRPEEKNRNYNRQEWTEKEVLKDTYYSLYVDSLLRNRHWLYKVDYTNGDYHVLSCQEGPSCEYKQKIIVKEIERRLPEDHCLSLINENAFGGKVHELTIYENKKPHLNHKPQDELKKDFEKRIKGLSKFANILVDKLELYLKKQVDRIELLKKLLGNNYEKHFFN